MVTIDSHKILSLWIHKYIFLYMKSFFMSFSIILYFSMDLEKLTGYIASYFVVCVPMKNDIFFLTMGYVSL